MSSKPKLKKLVEAESLIPGTGTETGTPGGQTTEKLTSAIKIYKLICMDPVISVDDKLDAILSLSARIPDEAREMITRWRDMIPFVVDKHLNTLVSLLVKVSSNSLINAHERTVIAVALYNYAMLDMCFKCFASIAVDLSVPVNYRIEACRYLYSTDDTDHKQLSQECLTDIIEDISIESNFRYKIIAGFISNKGVVSYLNASKIKVPYDEEYVYSLQMSFFQDVRNGVRERILSGQHLLQMGCVSDDEKIDVGTKLLSIASNATLDENVRADAADVMIRLGRTNEVTAAREIIINMGHSAVHIKNENFLDRVKTLYNNSQNMHDESIDIGGITEKFIEKMLSGDTRLIPFEDAENEVTNIVRSKRLEKKNNFLVYRSLNRISIDTATFTTKKATLAEIFIHVWLRIKTYSGDVRTTLEDRLIEELIDMGDTCSTGHSGRFINVLSTVDPDLNIKISYEAQIIANVAGRMNACIRDIPDHNVKSSVSMGMFPGASEEDVAVCKNFMSVTLKKICDEMYKEFVGGKYLSEKEFFQYFENAKKEWL